MRVCVVAFLLSLALHALVAAALVFGHCRISRRVTSPELDVSKSELTIVITEAKPTPPKLKTLPSPMGVESLRIAPKTAVSNPSDAERILRLQDPRPRPFNLQLSTVNLQPPTPSPQFSTADLQPPTSNLQPRSSARVDAPPRPASAIRPRYPRGARERGEEGDVALEADVGADGSVGSARVVRSSGFADLDRAALEAVRKARFTPATSDGLPVARSVRLSLQFRLR